MKPYAAIKRSTLSQILFSSGPMYFRLFPQSKILNNTAFNLQFNKPPITFYNYLFSYLMANDIYKLLDWPILNYLVKECWSPPKDNFWKAVYLIEMIMQAEKKFCHHLTKKFLKRKFKYVFYKTCFVRIIGVETVLKCWKKVYSLLKLSMKYWANNFFYSKYRAYG